MNNNDDNITIFLMLVASIVAGYLGTMNIWVVNVKHARWHLNDAYMVLLMIGWMFILSYLFCSHMISSTIVLVLSILLVILMIYAIRNQSLINDTEFLNGMIPHHSMAILMAEKIKDKTSDPRIRHLADNIIKSQSNEIILMTKILNETSSNNYIF